MLYVVRVHRGAWEREHGPFESREAAQADFDQEVALSYTLHERRWVVIHCAPPSRAAATARAA